MNKGWPTAVVCVVLVASFLALSVSEANDEDELVDVLRTFLENVDTPEAHDRFWAHDLVYTSSSGTRTNKSEIMAGFPDSDVDEPEAASPSYAAEDVDVRLYGLTAVVAFRLVSVNANQERSDYFNTGTFLKRNGQWQVIAWQATKIP